MSTLVKVGDQAPDFTLRATGGSEITLSSLQGRPVVIVFYPGDDSPVCTEQLNSYNEGLDEFERVDAQVLGISFQSLDSHESFSEKYGLNFPLLADTDKHVSKLYGILGPLGFPVEACLSSMKLESFATPIELLPGSRTARCLSSFQLSSRCDRNDHR